MSNSKDVAIYILKHTDQIPAMKLQKLVYYSQAWSLVWDDQPLFQDEIQAWANGPVVPSLYACHRGEYSVYAGMFDGNEADITDHGRETIDAVLDTYGDKSPFWLSELTHMEDPWKKAREGVADGQRSNATISQGSMVEYYGDL
jgi:uncharacterized phage-associated protein